MGRVGFELKFACRWKEASQLTLTICCVAWLIVIFMPCHCSVSGCRLNSWSLVDCQKHKSWKGGSIDIVNTCLWRLVPACRPAIGLLKGCSVCKCLMLNGGRIMFLEPSLNWNCSEVGRGLFYSSWWWR